METAGGLPGHLQPAGRCQSLNFKITDAELEDGGSKRHYQYQYPAITKTLGTVFKLVVEPGEYTDSEIIVLLGENGTGKTTFIRLLAGIIKPMTGPLAFRR